MAKPTPAIDYANECLTSLDAGAKYSLGGATVTADANGHIPLPAATYASTKPIFYALATGSYRDSWSQTLNIGGYNTTPTVSDYRVTAPTVIGGSGSLYSSFGFSDCQYSLDSGATGVSPKDYWVTVSDIPGGTNVLIRRTSTSKYKSPTISMLVPEFVASQEATPTGKPPYKQGKITGLVSNATYYLKVGASVYGAPLFFATGFNAPTGYSTVTASASGAERCGDADFDLGRHH